MAVDGMGCIVVSHIGYVLIRVILFYFSFFRGKKSWTEEIGTGDDNDVKIGNRKTKLKRFYDR